MWRIIVGVALLALVHAGAVYVPGLARQPRSRWLSAAAGVSLGYLFMMLLPELAEEQELRDTWLGGFLSRRDIPIQGFSLIGLCAFFGLEKLATRHRARADPAPMRAGIFWVHIGSFTIYNALVGYLLVRGKLVVDAGYWLYVVAMALHFLVNDVALQDLHRLRYRQVGRWILAAAAVAGVLFGWKAAIPEGTAVAAVATLSGGIALNVLKEELPEAREAKFLPFVTAAGAYSLLAWAAT